MTNPNPSLDRILRRPEVLRCLGMKKAALNKLIARGLFPRPFYASDAANCAMWLESEVIRWQQDWVAARKAKAAALHAQRAADVARELEMKARAALEADP